MTNSKIWNADTLSGFNIPLARKVLEQITQEQEQSLYFEMAEWFGLPSDAYDELDMLPHSESVELLPDKFCGTTACLAGTAFVLDPDTAVSIKRGGVVTVTGSDGQEYVDESELMNGHHPFVVYGAKLLGMTLGDAFRLFCHVQTEEAVEVFTDLINQAEKKQFGV